MRWWLSGYSLYGYNGYPSKRYIVTVAPSQLQEQVTIVTIVTIVTVVIIVTVFLIPGLVGSLEIMFNFDNKLAF